MICGRPQYALDQPYSWANDVNGLVVPQQAQGEEVGLYVSPGIDTLRSLRIQAEGCADRLSVESRSRMVSCQHFMIRGALAQT